MSKDKSATLDNLVACAAPPRGLLGLLRASLGCNAPSLRPSLVCSHGASRPSLRAARRLPLRRSASQRPRLPARALPPPPRPRDASAAAPSGPAMEGWPAVVGHRWSTAAGLDERALLWQVVAAGLCALHGRCTARRRARGRRVLRWRRLRRARRVERCALRRYVCGTQCTVCVSVRVCTRSAPVVRASQMCRLNILSIPTLIRRSHLRPTDSRPSPSAPGCWRTSPTPPTTRTRWAAPNQRPKQ